MTSSGVIEKVKTYEVLAVVSTDTKSGENGMVLTHMAYSLTD